MYILQSVQDGSYYIDWTENIKSRLDRYNSGRSKYTKVKMPWKIVYLEIVDTKKAAIIKENKLRSTKAVNILKT